jgi:hypothetical protein
MRITGRLIELRSWQVGDEDALVRNLNNRKVWLNLTDRIPHPLRWLTHRLGFSAARGPASTERILRLLYEVNQLARSASTG